jgi:geranylgeranyl diphosphate synthase type I
MDIKPLLSQIELELQKQVARLDAPRTQPFHEMLTYHMGWTGEGAGGEATGKRIRPLMLLLCTAACGASWQLALPAAAAVELVHNFSFHDDIQDNPIRRGRPTTCQMGRADVGDALLFCQIRRLWAEENYPQTLPSAPEFCITRALTSPVNSWICLAKKGQTLPSSY